MNLRQTLRKTIKALIRKPLRDEELFVFVNIGGASGTNLLRNFDGQPIKNANNESIVYI